MGTTGIPQVGSPVMICDWSTGWQWVVDRVLEHVTSSGRPGFRCAGAIGIFVDSYEGEFWRRPSQGDAHA